MILMINDHTQNTKRLLVQVFSHVDVISVLVIIVVISYK